MEAHAEEAGLACTMASSPLVAPPMDVVVVEPLVAVAVLLVAEVALLVASATLVGWQ